PTSAISSPDFMIASTGKCDVTVRYRNGVRCRQAGGRGGRSPSCSRATTGRFAEVGAPPLAALVDGYVDDTILRRRNRVPAWHALPSRAGPSRLDTVQRHMAVIDQRVAHGVGTSLR